MLAGGVWVPVHWDEGKQKGRVAGRGGILRRWRTATLMIARSHSYKPDSRPIFSNNTNDKASISQRTLIINMGGCDSCSNSNCSCAKGSCTCVRFPSLPPSYQRPWAAGLISCTEVKHPPDFDLRVMTLFSTTSVAG